MHFFIFLARLLFLVMLSKAALAQPKLFRKMASVAVASSFASVVALAQEPNAIPNFQEGAINVQDKGNANADMIKQIQALPTKQIRSLKFPGPPPTTAQMLTRMEANNVRSFKVLLENQEMLATNQGLLFDKLAEVEASQTSSLETAAYSTIGSLVG